MDISARKLDQLTGKEFFKPKAFKSLSYVYDDLIKEVSKKTVVLVGGLTEKEKLAIAWSGVHLT